MARGPGSPTPDDRTDRQTDGELVDPLQVASEGLEDVRAPRTPGRESDADRTAPDPLAVLSLAIDRGETPGGEVKDHPRRRLLGRLTARGRTPSSPTRPDVPDLQRAADSDEGAVPDAAPTPEAPDEPRVTTWADDFAEHVATGEWPAVVGDDADVRGEGPVPVPEARPDPAPRRRAGRRRRGKDDVVAAQPAPAPPAAPVPDPAERERRAAEEARLAAAEAEAERARQEAEDARQQRAAVHVEQAWLAAEAAEAERIEAERLSAQHAEDARLEGLAIDAVDVEELWLAAERAEADRIQADREAAQQAEDERLELLVEQARYDAGQAEHDRIEAVRVAAQQAESDRLEVLRGAEQERAAAERAVTDQAASEHVQAGRAPEEPPQADPPAPVAPAPAPSAVATAPTVTPRPSTSSASRGGEPIPRFVEFRPGSVLRYVFGALFVVFAVAAVIAIFRAVSAGSGDVILLATGLTLGAMVCWWALLSWTPPVVSVSNGLLELSRGARATSWDLRDPATEITFRGRPASRSWKAILVSDGGRPVTISARQVDPAQFVEIVHHYQSLGPEADR